MSSAASKLGNELGPALVGYELETVHGWLDLEWDADVTFDEMVSHDRAVRVTHERSAREALFHRIRSELRYQLLASKDPYSSDYHLDEIGIVESPTVAVALCREYLDSDKTFTELQTRRTSKGVRLGRWQE